MLERPVEPSPPYITYEQFLCDPAIDERSEWVDGRVVPMATVAELHNLLTGWLIQVLRGCIQDEGLGRIYHEPFNQKLPASSGRSPDIMVVLAQHYDRVRSNYLDGPADVVIEVLSRSTAGVDRGDKYLEYEAGGVPEYWLLDPQRQVAEFYQLDSSGRYQLVPPSSDGRYTSAVLPGFWLDVAWLWSRPPARVVEAALGLR